MIFNLYTYLSKIFAHITLVNELSVFIKSNEYQHSSGETKDAAVKAKYFIGLLAEYKVWKIAQLKAMKLDPYSPDDMRKITIDKFANFGSSDIRKMKQTILKSSAPSEKTDKEKRKWKSLEEQRAKK